MYRTCNWQLVSLGTNITCYQTFICDFTISTLFCGVRIDSSSIRLVTPLWSFALLSSEPTNNNFKLAGGGYTANIHTNTNTYNFAHYTGRTILLLYTCPLNTDSSRNRLNRKPSDTLQLRQVALSRCTCHDDVRCQHGGRGAEWDDITNTWNWKQSFSLVPYVTFIFLRAQNLLILFSRLCLPFQRTQCSTTFMLVFCDDGN